MIKEDITMGESLFELLAAQAEAPEGGKGNYERLQEAANAPSDSIADDLADMLAASIL